MTILTELTISNFPAEGVLSKNDKRESFAPLCTAYKINCYFTTHSENFSCEGSELTPAVNRQPGFRREDSQSLFFIKSSAAYKQQLSIPTFNEKSTNRNNIPYRIHIITRPPSTEPCQKPNKAIKDQENIARCESFPNFY